MKKNLYIVLCALSFSACTTVNTPPIDDAYIYPDKNAPSAEVQTSETTEVTPQSPALEIVSQQDTTITVRIKR